MKKIEFSREIPVMHDTDVIVAGGGIAGTCAACAAAGMGMKTALIERFATLGGDGVAGGVRGFCGETRGQGKTFDEIIHDLEQFGAIGPYRPARQSGLGGRHYDHEILALVLQELALRHGITLFLHAMAVDVVKDQGKIKGLVVAGKSGLGLVAGKVVIDCTGDADVAAAAGCETMKGRPGDGLQLPMSLIFFARRGTLLRRGPAIPASYVTMPPIETKDGLPMTSISRVGSTGKSIKIKVPGFDGTSSEQLTSAEIQGRRKMMQVLDYYRRVEKKNWELDHCSPMIGIREGRRIHGEYTLTVDDVRAGRQFSDAVAVGCYQLDAHDPTDDKRTYILPVNELKVPPYQIPARSLIPKGMHDLLVAGRNVSADQLALSSARVMTTCAMTGQAAGIVAAISIQKGCSVQDMASVHYGALRKCLDDAGMQIDLAFYQ